MTNKNPTLHLTTTPVDRFNTWLGVVIALLLFLLAGRTQAAELTVPYTSQAPLGQWNDPRQQDGCEEASILMAIMWAQGSTYTPEQARDQIVGLSDFEQYFKGYFEDTSAQDTANLLTQYFGYPQTKVGVIYNIGADDIKASLDAGELVIVPINPRLLSTSTYNRWTTRHTVVVTGYDPGTGDLIFNDPLAGPGRRASAASFQSALGDYNSGRHLPAPIRPTAMIVVVQ